MSFYGRHSSRQFLIGLCLVAFFLLDGHRQGFANTDLLHLFPSSDNPNASIPQRSGKSDLFLEADSLSFDQNRNVYIASGNVRVRYEGRVGKADYMEYSAEKETLEAKGHVEIQEKTGDVLFAETLILDRELTAGFAKGISLRLGKHVKIIGNEAKQVSPVETEISNVVYSPCSLCSDGKTDPLWQMRAEKIIRNTEEQTIEYTNPVLEVKGTPVLALPYFVHADPMVTRKSGFVMPKFVAESENGYGVRLPYYWNISPDKDFLFKPTIYANTFPLTRGLYRQYTNKGHFQVDLAGTFSDKGKRQQDTYTQDSFRGSVLSSGRFFTGETDRWGFDVRKATDDTFLRRYNIFNESYLTNRLYYEHPFADRTGYVNGYAFSYQGLGTNNVDENNPIALPFIEARKKLAQDIAGGQIEVSGNVLALHREDGLQTRRLSNRIDWNRTDQLDSGLKFKTFAQLRGDVYNTTNGFDPSNSKVKIDDGTKGRFLPMAGAEVSYPLYGQHEGFSDIIEPIAQVIWSPYGGNSRGIPNEDSASFEFSDENLFSHNRFAGFDRVETGPRMNVGVRHAFDFQNGQRAEYTLGQSFRLKEDPLFKENSGLAGKRSDYVGRISYSPNKNFEFFHAFRYSEKNFESRQSELGANIKYGRVRLMADYVNRQASGFDDSQTERQELIMTSHFDLGDGWLVNGGIRRDLHNNQWIEARGGIGYATDCLILHAQLRRQFTEDRDIKPSTDFLLNVTLIPFGRDMPTP